MSQDAPKGFKWASDDEMELSCPFSHTAKRTEDNHCTGCGADLDNPKDFTEREHGRPMVKDGDSLLGEYPNRTNIALAVPSIEPAVETHEIGTLTTAQRLAVDQFIAANTYHPNHVIAKELGLLKEYVDKYLLEPDGA